MSIELKDLKKDYEVLAKKYKLPAFEKLNWDFEIEKIDKETDSLLRIIRKIMMDKILHSLSFIEMLINPANAPRLYYNYLKNMSQDDRKVLEEIYSGLGELNLSAFNLEIDYSEKDEAEAIKMIFEGWNKLKPSFRKVFDNMRKSLKAVNEKKEKSYFG